MLENETRVSYVAPLKSRPACLSREKSEAAVRLLLSVPGPNSSTPRPFAPGHQQGISHAVGTEAPP